MSGRPGQQELPTIRESTAGSSGSQADAARLASSAAASSSDGTQQQPPVQVSLSSRACSGSELPHSWLLCQQPHHELSSEGRLKTQAVWTCAGVLGARHSSACSAESRHAGPSRCGHAQAGRGAISAFYSFGASPPGEHGLPYGQAINGHYRPMLHSRRHSESEVINSWPAAMCALSLCMP